MGPLPNGFLALTRTHYWVSPSILGARIEACARFYAPTLHLATRLFLSGPFQETFDRLSFANHPWNSGKPRRSAIVCPAATHSRVCHPCGTAAHCFAALDWVPACGQLLCLCAVFPTVVSQIHPSTVCSRLSFTRVFCSTLDIFFNIEAYASAVSATVTAS